LGDVGRDVQVAQHLLNLQLSLPMEYAPRDPGYKELSEREYPDLWGYYWGEGARKRYARVHQNPHKQRRPISLPAQDPHLAEDGLFGPQTERAVTRFQCRISGFHWWGRSGR